MTTKSSHDFGPPPPEELGRNLETIADARRWLMHPSNWIESWFYIIRWDGIVPKIRKQRALELLKQPEDTGIFIVAVQEQRRRKTRSSGPDPLSSEDD